MPVICLTCLCDPQIEMYADTGARGGVLEAEGVVEIKFRTPDLIKTMHRLDPILLRLEAEGDVGSEGAIKKREAELLPIYRQVGCSFLVCRRGGGGLGSSASLANVTPAWVRLVDRCPSPIPLLCAAPPSLTLVCWFALWLWLKGDIVIQSALASSCQHSLTTVK